jgi:UDP-2,4-diacetamido-2,4,6-trideoxy-beta-L-altropyranose hydrolase
MRIAIRADAATHIGIGHVMRCLTLANALKMKGAEVSFVCRPFAGHLGERITAEGHGLYLLPPPSQTIKPLDLGQTPPHATWLGENWETDLTQTQIGLNGKQFDWLIVDHYSLDNRWENEMRNFASKIMVIDDLADRKHDCDILLDQTLGRNEEEYQHWIPENCTLLAGSNYALLRPEFEKLRVKTLEKRKNFNGVHRLLVAMGGIDQHNITANVLEAFDQVKWAVEPFIDVVLGSKALHLENVRQCAKDISLRAAVSVDVNDMALRMSDADFAVGAGGTTTWERCCLGLPVLVIQTAEHQSMSMENLRQLGGQMSLSSDGEITPRLISEGIAKLVFDNEALSEMSRKASEICDGCGVQRVLNFMDTTLYKKRKV